MNHHQLRIAHVTPYYWPVVGGITTYVDSIAKAQRRLAADVRIFTRKPAGGEDVEAGPSNNLLFARWARHRLRHWHPDVVHAHADWSAFAASQGLFRSVVPVTVFTVHTDFGPARSSVREAVLRRLMKRANLVTTMNETSLRALKERFPGLRGTALLRPGTTIFTEDPMVTRNLVSEHSLSGCYPKICAVSMMVWPEKVRGLKLLIRAMPSVIQLYPTARLIIVGDGPLRDGLEEETVLANVAASVVFVGKRDNPAAYIALSDIFAHISFRDAFPQVILEALSVGRAVIVNEDVGANIPSEVLETGIQVVESSAAAVARGTLLLSGNPTLRSEVSRRGQVLARSEFTWDKLARELMVLYGFSSGD